MEETKSEYLKNQANKVGNDFLKAIKEEIDTYESIDFTPLLRDEEFKKNHLNGEEYFVSKIYKQKNISEYASDTIKYRLTLKKLIGASETESDFPVGEELTDKFYCRNHKMFPFSLIEDMFDILERIEILKTRNLLKEPEKNH